MCRGGSYGCEFTLRLLEGSMNLMVVCRTKVANDVTYKR